MTAVTRPALRTDARGERLRLLHVHAHPDDESSKGAATTARYTAEGVEVMVVSCTGGERGDILNPRLKGDPRVLRDMAQVRREEMAAAAAVLRRERFAARVVVDGEELHGEATAVIVANFGAVLGGLFHFGPDIREDDGRLDVCVFRPASFLQSAAAFLRLVRKDFRPHPALAYRAGRTIAVETSPPPPDRKVGSLSAAWPKASSRTALPSAGDGV